MSSAATILPIVFFFATYAFIAIGRVPGLALDRPMIALTGALAMIGVGALSLDHAYRAIHLDTIALLFGTMVLVGYLRVAGLFAWIGEALARRATSPTRTVWQIVLVSGVLSALFVNDTVCILLTPIVLDVALRLRADPKPFLLALAMGANVGSAATLTGNPQNMLIGVFSGIPFGAFFASMALPSLVALGLVGLVLERAFRASLARPFERHAHTPSAIDLPALRRLGLVTVVMLVLFMTPIDRALGLAHDGEPILGRGQALAFGALVAAALAAFVSREPPSKVLASVDLSLLVLFAGLFVVVEAMVSLGYVAKAFAELAPWIGDGPVTQSVRLASVSVLGANVVSNVPFVLVARSWMVGFSDPELAWRVLALASTFAGNLTIVGSVANVIVVELAKERAPIGFVEYLRVGVPVTLLSIALGVAMLLASHAMGVF